MDLVFANFEIKVILVHRTSICMKEILEGGNLIHLTYHRIRVMVRLKGALRSRNGGYLMRFDIIHSMVVDWLNFKLGCKDATRNRVMVVEGTKDGNSEKIIVFLMRGRLSNTVPMVETVKAYGEVEGLLRINHRYGELLCNLLKVRSSKI